MTVMFVWELLRESFISPCSVYYPDHRSLSLSCFTPSAGIVYAEGAGCILVTKVPIWNVSVECWTAYRTVLLHTIEYLISPHLTVLLQCPVYPLWNRCVLCNGLSILYELRIRDTCLQGSFVDSGDISECNDPFPSEYDDPHQTSANASGSSDSLIVASGCHIWHIHLPQCRPVGNSSRSSYVSENFLPHLIIRPISILVVIVNLKPLTFPFHRLSGTVATIAICRSVLDLRTAAELANAEYTDGTELSTVTKQQLSQPNLPRRISTSGNVPVFIVTDSMATSNGQTESAHDRSSQSRGEV